MSDAPERIWAHPTEREPVPSRERKNAKWLRGMWKDHNSNAHGDVEYVRVDIIEELEAENGRLKELLSGFYPSEDIEDLLSGWMIWWKSKGGSDE